jgi:putative endonuclease
MGNGRGAHAAGEREITAPERGPRRDGTGGTGAARSVDTARAEDTARTEATAGQAASARGRRLGRHGEQAAAEYLAAAGYRVLERNWICRDPDLRGELDLIARQRETLVICEVKTRSGPALAHPAQAVTPQKAARLRRLAARWLRDHPIGGPPGTGGTGVLGSAVTAIGAIASAGSAAASGPRSGRRTADHRGLRLRIDVIAVRTGPRAPYPLLTLDHLIGVA